MSLITRLDNFRKKYYKRDITINGVSMNYYLCGKGDHVLVLLQGDLGMPEQWMNYIEDLSGIYRILAPSYPAGIDTTEELCSALRSLLRFLHIDRAVFIGDSYGAYLAQLMAIRYPELTESLCLFSAAGLQEDTLRALRRQNGKLRRTAMAYRLMGTSKVRETERKQFLDAAAAGGCDDLSGMGLFFDEMCRDLDLDFALHMLALRQDIPDLPPCSREQFAYLDRKVLLALPDNDELYSSQMQLDLIADMTRPKMLNGLWKGHLSPLFQTDVILKGLRRFLLTLDKEPRQDAGREAQGIFGGESQWTAGLEGPETFGEEPGYSETEEPAPFGTEAPDDPTMEELEYLDEEDDWAADDLPGDTGEGAGDEDRD